jgi:hypothetical protein
VRVPVALFANTEVREDEDEGEEEEVHCAKAERNSKQPHPKRRHARS